MFVRKPSLGRGLFARGLKRPFVRGRRRMSPGRKKGLCVNLVAFGSDRVVDKHGWCRCCAKHPEKTHVKLRGEASLRGGRSVADSIRGTYTASLES
jgi:hypothetical protein